MSPKGGQRPADLGARLRALTEMDKTFLVEAGAGSGKTSIMAGRVALLIASGEDPGAIAAITFTEAAAAELALRIEESLRELASARAPKDLEGVLPNGLSAAIVEGAIKGLDSLDRMVATTIHGFAQRILRPYPLEAGTDPGAQMADPEVAEMAFEENVERWMRDLLNDETASFAATLFEEAPLEAAETVRNVATAMRGARGLMAPPASWNPQKVEGLRRSIEGWIERFPDKTAAPDDVKKRTAGFRQVLDALAALPVTPVARVLKLALPKGLLATQKGEFYSKAATKKDWDAIGKSSSWGSAEITARIQAMEQAWNSAKAAWADLKSHAAAVAARRLTEEVRQALDRYTSWKRSAALLDFDDLLAKARNLLAENDPVRQKLADRYRRVLVDEFQDTDPLQMEILWRLCGDPHNLEADWRSYRIRAGSLFLVGDPKQAIYRFRGADVRAYLEAKELLTKTGVGEVLAISVNFRSTQKILTRVNTIYEPVLNGAGQPGFTALEAYREEEGRDVQALEVEIGPELLDDRGNPKVESLRAGEAATVADFLTRIIGSLVIPDGKGGERRVRPGDIALLAPAGTGFWVYEAELERAGIPVAPQAGKGFLDRQEVLDLTALARLLGDPRDSLALGAFLRGGVLGFTDEEILDALAALPGPGRKRLSIGLDLQALPKGRFRDAMEQLQVLRRMAMKTTPFQALSVAVETFAIRAVLTLRHPRSVERSLANLDAFLALSKAWDTKGLKEFADELRRRRDEGTRQVEGRPDLGSDAVSIVTMHSAKGLEWPVVVPINMTTQISDKSGPVVGPDGLLFRILGEAVSNYETANQVESQERAFERQRLLYVADTRAREFLVIPRYSKEAGRQSWSGVCGARSENIPSFAPSDFEPKPPERAERPDCSEDETAFMADVARVAKAHRRITRRKPSRHEAGHETHESVEISSSHEEEVFAPTAVKGGPVRGQILHKLMEEILTGETTEPDLEARAGELIAELEAGATVDAAEVAETIRRTLALPEIAVLCSGLMAEVDLVSLSPLEDGEELTVGIADALGVAENGQIDVVIDWKSDVNPDAATLSLYRAQLAVYVKATKARRGLIVLMTSGRVLEVVAAAP